MATGQTMITRAMKAIRYLGRTQTPTAQDTNDALTEFNAMLDSWSSGEKLMSYVVLERSFALVANKSQYTIGTSGTPDVNATRPMEIGSAYVQDTNGNNFGLWVRPRDWWNQIGNRSATITSQLPTDLFYDPQYPNGVINIFPTPSIAYTLFYDSTQDQVDFTTLGQTLSMPNGYEEAYVLNLAVRLVSAGFPMMMKPEEWASLQEAAKTAKANVKRVNIKDVLSAYDEAIVSRSQATYNIYRDGYGTTQP